MILKNESLLHRSARWISFHYVELTAIGLILWLTYLWFSVN